MRFAKLQMHIFQFLIWLTATQKAPFSFTSFTLSLKISRNVSFLAKWPKNQVNRSKEGNNFRAKPAKRRKVYTLHNFHKK